MFFKYNTFALGWALIIFFLAILPSDDSLVFLFFNTIPADKVLHFINYMVLVYLFLIGFNKQYQHALLNYYPVMSAIVISMVYGMILEVMQETLIPDRTFELADIFANFTGCITGSALFTLIYFKL